MTHDLHEQLARYADNELDPRCDRVSEQVERRVEGASEREGSPFWKQRFILAPAAGSEQGGHGGESECPPHAAPRTNSRSSAQVRNESRTSRGACDETRTGSRASARSERTSSR